MKPQPNRSTCNLCNADFARSGMSRHLKSCLGKHFKSTTQAKAKPLYHLHIYATYIPDYFIHVLMDESVRFDDLDDFLRTIWLECCGHMSSFIDSGKYDEIDMGDKISALVEPGTSLAYMYDFGSTTELTIKCLAVYSGADIAQEKIQIISRNAQPPIICDGCGNAAAETICSECQWQGTGWLCGKCAESHECDDEMFLSVVNSPRAGVCAYEG